MESLSCRLVVRACRRISEVRVDDKWRILKAAQWSSLDDIIMNPATKVMV